MERGIVRISVGVELLRMLEGDEMEIGLKHGCLLMVVLNCGVWKLVCVGCGKVMVNGIFEG